MATTINLAKQLAAADTPLLFFQCVLASGGQEYWCTHALQFDGNSYSARVLKHNMFELQLSADDAMDGVSHLSLTLANADSYLSEMNRAVGFKGAQLTVRFAFADLTAGAITTESTVLFRGIAGDPDEISEEHLRLTFTNKLGLQRVPVPEVRIQRTCPWTFPATIEQRTEAKDGGALGKYSRLYRCGYSADVSGGVGNLSMGSMAFTSCDGSRTQCQQRGMFSKDAQGNTTARFGGFEFVPSAVNVRTAGDKTSHVSPLIENSAKYNDAVPLIYGTGWLKAPVDFSRNDGNLTHAEVILSLGAIAGVLKVVVNDVEIPIGLAGADMGSTGWYSLITSGLRDGAFNNDFTDAHGLPAGDPAGSIAVLQVVVPNRICSGSSLPKVEVLVQGLQLDTYGLDGTFASTSFSDNPAWVILDILKRCGWADSEINLASFAQAAQFCNTLITTTDNNGNPLQVPRYQCNLILTRRQSAAAVIRGVRVGSSLMLRYGPTGLLELLPETTIAGQHASLPDGSNSVESLQGGWPAYEVSDHSGSFSGIVRNPDGSSSVRLSSRTVAETSNRLSLEFQDAFNEYQQDSLSIVDAGDTALIGYEITSQSTALGVANMSQAARVLLRQLDKSTKGNLYLQFQTSFRALKVRPGDIIAITYVKENLIRAPFRVLKLVPSLNFELITILAQVHDDDWYSDSPTVLANAGRQPLSHVQTPRPLLGTLPHRDAQGNLEFFDFPVSEVLQAQSDGSATDTLTIGFSLPTKPVAGMKSVPLLSLAAQYTNGSGSLPASATYYYAVAGVDGHGNEGPLSFTVPAIIPDSGHSTNSVTITALSFGPDVSAFNVYRGTSPQVLYRIASDVLLSSSFTDNGLPALPIGPPDVSFDHANFYYRKEYAGAYSATAWTATAVSCADMGAVPLAYVGRALRIVEGTGRGQERLISANDATSITVSSAWSITPDATSRFVIVDNAWRFAAVSATTPLQFEIPYEPGLVIQLTGRSANVNDLEAAPELCPVTRLALGGGKADSGTAVAPAFTLSAPGGGLLSLSQVGFADLSNIASVSSGTLEVFSWSELMNPGQFTLVNALDPFTTIVRLRQVQAYPGQIIQCGTELMAVLSVDQGSNTYLVSRGVLSSVAALHSPGDPILHLTSSTLVVPFTLSFFKNRASLNFVHTVAMPDIRVSAAQFFVTNAFGDSQATQQCYTTGSSAGLRTLSGGQFSLQVGNSLATQQNAAPPLLVEASHSIRDIRASITQPSAGFDVVIDLLQNGIPFCKITLPSGANTSSVIDGLSLPPLTEGAIITTDIKLSVLSNYPDAKSPGRDLTITIRL